jgi:hypothetical protein
MTVPTKLIRFLSLAALTATVILTAVPAQAEEKKARGKWDAPWRVLLQAGVIEGWTQGSSEDRGKLIMPEYNEVHRLWSEMPGVRMIATIDDHLTQAGTPGERNYGWYELYEICELATVGKMLQLIRRSALGKVRLDKYMRYDALVGTPQVEAEQVFGILDDHGNSPDTLNCEEKSSD